MVVEGCVVVVVAAVVVDAVEVGAVMVDAAVVAVLGYKVETVYAPHADP